MRLPLKALGLGLALAAAGFLVLHHAGAQDGEPNVVGNWTGKVAFKDYSMNTGDRGSKGAFPATMAWDQFGGSVTCTITVDAEDGPQVFNLVGFLGNGNFWLQNESVDDPPILLSGHVSGSGAKMKMKMNGVFVDGTDVNELKFAAAKVANPPKK